MQKVDKCQLNQPLFVLYYGHFGQKLSINHELSSPHRPSSNGKSEKGVQILKHLLSKCSYKWDIFNKHLAYLRQMPSSNHGFSMSQLFLGRQARSSIPLHPKAYSFDFQSSLEGHRSKFLNILKLQAQNPGSYKILDGLQLQQRVAVFSDKTTPKWSLRGRVTGFFRPSTSCPINYQIKLEADGSKGRPKSLIRSRLHLLKVPEGSQPVVPTAPSASWWKMRPPSSVTAH